MICRFYARNYARFSGLRAFFLCPYSKRKMPPIFTDKRHNINEFCNYYPILLSNSAYSYRRCAIV